MERGWVAEACLIPAVETTKDTKNTKDTKKTLSLLMTRGIVSH